MTFDIHPDTLINQYLLPWGSNILLAGLIFVIGRWLSRILVNLAGKLLHRAKLDNILIQFIQSITQALLTLFIIIAALDQVGVNTTSLAALLGAAGLAVGLSLQDSLKNFAAGVMLLMLRPFKAGDTVEVAGITGKVEGVRIFSTTLCTGDNKEITVPNGKIYSDNITNYSARETRRIDMIFGIGYDDDLKNAKAILQRLIDDDSRILKDPAPLIAVGELGESSINLTVRPWVRTADYWKVLYDLNEQVKLAFDEAGISIPFPQMDIHLTSQKEP